MCKGKWCLFYQELIDDGVITKNQDLFYITFIKEGCELPHYELSKEWQRGKPFVGTLLMDAGKIKIPDDKKFIEVKLSDLTLEK